MLLYILVKTVGAGPAPQARSLRAAFVTSAILLEKLTRTFWKTCIRAFFFSVLSWQNPVVILCFAEKDLLSLMCTLFSQCFFFHCQGRLPGEPVTVQYSSVYSHREKMSVGCCWQECLSRHHYCTSQYVLNNYSLTVWDFLTYKK